MNAFGISPKPKPAVQMLFDAASQLDPAALYDVIQIIADRLPAKDMERLANTIGSVAWDKQREEG